MSQNDEQSRILKAMIETDWTEGGKSSYDWFLGMMLGTDEYFNKTEKDTLMEKCNNIVIEHLISLDDKRLQQMTNKARMSNSTFMSTFGKNAFGNTRSYAYDDNVVKGLK